MTTPLKTNLSVGALIVGSIAFLDGNMLLGYSPATFAVAAGFTLLAALLGARWIRVVAICLCAASVAKGIHHFERKQRIDGMIKAVKERAETNSGSTR